MPGVIALTRRGASSNARVRAGASIAASTAASVYVPAIGLQLIQPENKTIDPVAGRWGAPFFTQ